MNKYDVIVIGAGPGGYVTALDLASQKLKVALIEKKYLGGNCVNYGCIPTKALLSSVKKLNTLKNVAQFGIKVDDIKFDYSIIQNYRANLKEKMNNNIGQLLIESNVDFFLGNAQVIDNHTVRVNDHILTFENLVLATGSRNRFLNLDGFAKGKEVGVVVDSDALLYAPVAPKSLTIIGGGPISVEFAYLFASIGTKVTILQDMDTIVPQFDISSIRLATNILESLGVEIITNSKVKALNEDLELVFEHDNETKKIYSEKYLVSVGRIINSECFQGLNLKTLPNGKLELNDHLQTSEPNIYAIGDVAGALQLSNVAYMHSNIVVHHILQKPWKPLDFNNVPYALYLNPEIASVGKTEHYLENYHKDKYIKVELPGSKFPRNLAEQNTKFGFFKIYVDKENHKILGAHIGLDNAGLIINEIALAMNNNLTILDLAQSTHAHPTLSEAVYYAARAISLKVA